MKSIMVYDDTAEMLERIAERHDTTVAEVLEMMIMDEQDLEEAFADEDENV